MDYIHILKMAQEQQRLRNRELTVTDPVMSKFTRKNVLKAKVRIRKIRKYFERYLGSDTVEMVAKLLYSHYKIASQRKLVKAQRMFITN